MKTLAAALFAALLFSGVNSALASDDHGKQDDHGKKKLA